jgi:hypothetical protein
LLYYLLEELLAVGILIGWMGVGEVEADVPFC